MLRTFSRAASALNSGQRSSRPVSSIRKVDWYLATLMQGPSPRFLLEAGQQQRLTGAGPGPGPSAASRPQPAAASCGPNECGARPLYGQL
jgi:hypothetical protein